jgi:hypothetical protein
MRSARATLDHPIDSKKRDRTDRGSNPAGTLARAVETDCRSEKARKQSARDTKQNRDDEAPRILSGHDKFAQNAGNSANNDPANKPSIHRTSPIGCENTGAHCLSACRHGGKTGRKLAETRENLLRAAADWRKRRQWPWDGAPLIRLEAGDLLL